jgi:hypothetical protein
MTLLLGDALLMIALLFDDAPPRQTYFSAAVLFDDAPSRRLSLSAMVLSDDARSGRIFFSAMLLFDDAALLPSSCLERYFHNAIAAFQ